MTDTFCGALRVLYDRLKGTGARFVGFFNADGYDFNHSPAIVDGKTVGLVLDEVNHADLTDARIAAWTEQVKNEI